MATPTGQPTGTAADSYSHVERIGFAVFMIVGSLAVLGATIIHPPHGIRATDGASYYHAAYDHTTRFFVAHTLFFLSGVTLIVAVIGLTRLIRPTHPKAAFWGLVLSAMGFVGWGAFDGMDFMTYVAGASKSLDTNTMQTYIDDALANQAVAIPTGIVFGILVVGLIVVCIGEHRAGIQNMFLALLLPIGIVGVLSFLPYPPLEIASGLCVCASVGTVGVRQLRAPDATRPKQRASVS
ncbi:MULTISPECIES: hypothetical protein [unclassified Kribbella]|uniref:hypothetical protein n=1 Tax=unclassified Kribbella TaxID=2644121 RepID=UPI0033EC559A